MCYTELFKLKVNNFCLSIFLAFFLGLLFFRSPKRNVHDTQNLTFVPTLQTRNLTGVTGLLCCCEIKTHSGKTISSFNIKSSITTYGHSIDHYFTRPIFLHVIHPELVYFHHVYVSICQICYSMFISVHFLLSLSSENSALPLILNMKHYTYTQNILFLKL